MMFRLPWKLWRYMEGGKMEEFGLEAKRHIIGPEEEETLAHQYATAFSSVLHRNNLYFAQVKNMVLFFLYSPLSINKLRNRIFRLIYHFTK